MRDVHLWRDDRGAHADVPHWVRHSPTGFEWGYRGSGPADLAYSILRAFFGAPFAEAHYQAFKEDVIATIPRTLPEYILTADVITCWVAQRVGEDGAQ